MNLPLHTRAAALVIALSTTAAIIVTLAEMGHPPPDGSGAILSLIAPETIRHARLAVVTNDTTLDADAPAQPQP